MYNFNHEKRQLILSQINRNQLCELMSFLKPAQVMNVIGEVLIIMLDSKYSGKGYQWRHFVKFSSDCKFLEILQNFQPESLNEVQKSNLKQFISHHKLNT